MEISEALRRELALLCGGGFESEGVTPGIKSDLPAIQVFNKIPRPIIDVPTRSQSSESKETEATNSLLNDKNQSKSLASINLSMQNVHDKDKDCIPHVHGPSSDCGDLSSSAPTRRPQVEVAATEERNSLSSSPNSSSKLAATPTMTSPRKPPLRNADIVKEILSKPFSCVDPTLTKEQLKIEERNYVELKRIQIESETGGEYSLGDTLDEVYCFGQNLSDSGYNECKILGKVTEECVRNNLKKYENSKRCSTVKSNMLIASELTISPCLRGPRILKNAVTVTQSNNNSVPESCGPLIDSSVVEMNTSTSPVKNNKFTSAELFFQNIQRVIDEGNKDFVQGPVHPCQLLPDNVGKRTVDAGESVAVSSIQSNPYSSASRYLLSFAKSDELPRFPEIECKVASPPPVSAQGKVAVSEEVEKRVQLIDLFREVTTTDGIENLSNFEDVCIPVSSVLNDVVDSETSSITDQEITLAVEDGPKKNGVDISTCDTSEGTLAAASKTGDSHGENAHVLIAGIIEASEFSPVISEELPPAFFDAEAVPPSCNPSVETDPVIPVDGCSEVPGIESISSLTSSATATSSSA